MILVHLVQRHTATHEQIQILYTRGRAGYSTSTTYSSLPLGVRMPRRNQRILNLRYVLHVHSEQFIALLESCSEIEPDTCHTHALLTHTWGVRRVRTPSSAGPTPSRVWVSIFSKLPSFRLTKGAGLSGDDAPASGSSAAAVRCTTPKRSVSRGDRRRRQAFAVLCELVSLLAFAHDRAPGWFAASEEGRHWS